MTISGAREISAASTGLPTASVLIFTLVASTNADRITLKQRTM
jgi:hypothetical protein